VLSLVAVAGAQAQSLSEWEASSGVLPDEAGLGYTVIQAGNVPAPTLESGVLTVSTSQNADNYYYVQVEPDVEPDRAFTIDWEMRLLSGSSSSTARAPFMMFITIDENVGTLLGIDADRIFFVVAGLNAGPPALVDTDDAFHAYRLEHDGSGGFVLYQDDVQLLSAAAYESAGSHGPLKRFGWGEGSILARGSFEISSMTHDFPSGLFKDAFEIP
jgi:hypothetical protein